MKQLKIKDYCDNHNCDECDFCKNKDEILKILLSQHKEKQKLTDDEKAILRNIEPKFKFIARDEDGELYVYRKKTTKKGDIWTDHCGNANFRAFNHLFQFVKWEDEEPWSIKELLEE